MLDMKRIVELINSLGYKTYTFDYSIYKNYILACMNWYKSTVPNFHTYKRYNGNTSVYREKAKLYMAKRVSEDVASLTCNQNMIINIEDTEERKFLLGDDGEMQGILGDNDFWSQMSKTIELTAGLGTAAMEVIIENLLQVEDKLVAGPNSKIKIARYNALNILPLSWNNNNDIEEVCFIDEYKYNDYKYLELRLHVKDEEGKYVIINKKCRVNDLNVENNITNKFIFLDTSSTISEFHTGSTTPWFTVFKINKINSYDLASPMGASVYGEAADVLKSIDDAFDTLCGEFKYSGKKIYYSKSLLQRDKNGNVIIPDDDDFIKDVFYFTGDNLDDKSDLKEPIQEKNLAIRSKEISEGIELLLNIFSFKCGLGNGFYKFSSGTVQKTATEVVSQNSDLFRNICKLQLGIEKNIYEIIKAILYASNYVFGTKYNVDCKMSVEFDASLTEDSTLQRERALKEVQLGILSVEEYRKRFYPELGNLNNSDQNTDM